MNYKAFLPVFAFSYFNLNELKSCGGFSQDAHFEIVKTFWLVFYIIKTEEKINRLFVYRKEKKDENRNQNCTDHTWHRIDRQRICAICHCKF